MPRRQAAHFLDRDRDRDRDRGRCRAPARGALADPIAEFSGTFLDVHEIDAADQVSLVVHQDMEVTLTGVLLGEQGTVTGGEFNEVRVPAIRHRPCEVLPVLSLENQQGRCMVSSEPLQPHHARQPINRKWNYPGALAVRT
jgi:hypothetical protein